MRHELPFSEVPINVRVRARQSLSKAERGNGVSWPDEGAMPVYMRIEALHA